MAGIWKRLGGREGGQEGRLQATLAQQPGVNGVGASEQGPPDLAQVSLGHAAAAAAPLPAGKVPGPLVILTSPGGQCQGRRAERVLSQPCDGGWGMGLILAGSQGPWARANGLVPQGRWPRIPLGENRPVRILRHGSVAGCRRVSFRGFLVNKGLAFSLRPGKQHWSAH